MKKSIKIKLRNRADSLLQEYIKKAYKLCLVCSKPLNCGHHFVSKKNSLTLRYYLPNIVPICKNHHSLVHCQPHLVEPQICFLLGKDWYDDLMKEKKRKVKFNIEWIQEQVNRLETLLKTV